MFKTKSIFLPALAIVTVAVDFACARQTLPVQIAAPDESPVVVPESSRTPALTPNKTPPPKPTSLLCSDSEYDSLYAAYQSWGWNFSTQYNDYASRGLSGNWTWFWIGRENNENRKIYFYRVGDQWKPRTIPAPAPKSSSPSLTTKEPINKLFVINELESARSKIKTILSTYPVQASDNSSYGALFIQCTTVNLQSAFWYRKIPTKDLEESQKHITNAIDLLNGTSGQFDANRLLSEVSATVTSLNTQDIIVQINKVGAIDWIKSFNDNTNIDKKAIDKLSPEYANSCIEGVTVFCDNLSIDINHISERLGSVTQHINERK